ncbi:MAG: class I SAM-dependent methyltransferase [Alphaproteobacteria bacterium]|nr:class I SAM-dependent methyltransferase [Alphaproteobacteria bacterium]
MDILDALDALDRGGPEGAAILPSIAHHLDNPHMRQALACRLAMADGRDAEALAMFAQAALLGHAERSGFLGTLVQGRGAHRRAIAFLARNEVARTGCPVGALQGLLFYLLDARAWSMADIPWPLDNARLADPALPRMPPACRDVVARLIATGHAEGPPTPMAGGEIAPADGDALFNLARMLRPRRILEIGFAKGLSTLHLMAGAGDALERHTVVDPLQYSAYRRNGVRNVTAAGFGDKLRLIPAPSHVGLPRLLAAGEGFDLIFIDGCHSFETTLVDALYADQLSEPGTIVAFHDWTMEPVFAAIEFMRSNRYYGGLTAAHVLITRRNLARFNQEQAYVPFATLRGTEP